MKLENKDIRLVKVGLDNLDDLVDLEPDKSQYNFGLYSHYRNGFRQASFSLPATR